MTNILIAADNGLIYTNGSPGDLRTAEPFAGTDVQCLAADPLRPEIVYCGTFERGLWCSANAGISWQPVGAGIAHAPVMAVSVSALDRAGAHGVVYAGTEPSALYRSEDGGATWRECAALRTLPSAPTWSFPPRPATSHVRCITLDPRAGGSLFVCIEAGALVRSADGGETWIDREPDGPWDTHTLRTHMNAPGRLYSAAGDGFMRPGRGYSESDDAGVTWQRPDEGLSHHYLWGAAVDATDPDAIIVSAASSPNQAHNPAAAESYVYWRQNGSAWQLAQGDLPNGRGMLAPVLAADDHTPGVFYAAANTGLYRSADAGRTWQQINIPWPAAHRSRHVNALLVDTTA